MISLPWKREIHWFLPLAVPMFRKFTLEKAGTACRRVTLSVDKTVNFRHKKEKKKTKVDLAFVVRVEGKWVDLSRGDHDF